MKRMDIILSQAMEEDFMYQSQLLDIALHYTKIPEVMGKGNCDPKMGDSIWPQLNTWIMTVVEDEDAHRLELLVARFRKEFPDEGISCFSSDVNVL